MAKKKAKKKTSKAKKPAGLYANIYKAQERQKHGGKKVRKKDEAGAPSEADSKRSKSKAKKSR